jgi:hypothetical protein
MRRRWLACGVAAAVVCGGTSVFAATSLAGANPNRPSPTHSSPAAVASPVALASPTSPARGGTTPTWPATTSPDTTNYSFPQSVSCISASACHAVGNYVNVSGVERPLVESWNGTAWSVTPSPNNGTSSSALSGVSCVSATFCEAVGNAVSASNAVQTLVETWNGTSWSITTSPNSGTGTNVLEAVSCVSTTFCKAVGYYSNASNLIQTLVESWNGTAWSIVASPNAGTGTNSLYGISCPTVTSCMAVGGSTAASGASQTLTESWKGTTWAIVTSPNNGTGTNLLNGVTCVSGGPCVAVGYYMNTVSVINTLVESWNGTSWTIATSPNSGTASNALYGVSCSSSTTCRAVGYFVNASNVIQTLIESWNGSTWSIVPSPNNGTGSNSFYGVSCVTTGQCQAVGSYMDSSTGFTRSLVESWNGASWSITATPGGILGNSLVAVSCESSGTCQAVGSFINTAGVAQTLVESYDGGAWLIIPTPVNGTGANTLAAVSCTSDSFCKAVGSYVNSSGHQQTLIESWNGVAWTIDTSLNTGTGNNALAGVSCVSATFCEAVGSSTSGTGVSQTLVETWNGTAWAITTSPNNGTGANAFAGVSCTATTFCEAVGSYVKFGGIVRPLAESWNGTVWAVLTTLNNGINNNSFSSVTCVSISTCKAVGFYLNISKVEQTLVESWNGTAFIMNHGVNSGTANNVLNAVTCPSATSCIAVGTFTSPSGVTQVLVETLTGTTWVLTSAASPGTAGNVLSGISCLSATRCRAAGTATGANHIPQTLIESHG